MFDYGSGGGATPELLAPPDARPLLAEPLPPPPAAIAPLSGPVQALLDALAAIRAAGPTGTLADGAALLCAAEAVQGLALRELAAVDRSRLYVEANCGSAGAWVQRVTGTSRQQARAAVRLADRLTDDFAPVGELLASGLLTVPHARAVIAGVRGIDADTVAEVLPALCQAALSTDPVTLSTRLRETAAAVSPALAEAAARQLEGRCGFVLSELPDGSFVPGGLLRPETGQLLRTALDALVATREAGDLRTAPQRREDALASLARHALDCDDAGLPATPSGRAQVLVVATLPSLSAAAGTTVVAGDQVSPPTDPVDALADAVTGDCPLPAPPARWSAGNGLLTRRQLLRLTCDADIARVVLDADSVVVDLGRLTRTVTPAQWRALVARDRHCVVKGCSQRPAGCQAHHVRHWSRGGPSDLDNYALLCLAHHGDVHDRGLWLQHADGRWMTPDGWVDGWWHAPP